MNEKVKKYRGLIFFLGLATLIKFAIHGIISIDATSVFGWDVVVQFIVGLVFLMAGIVYAFTESLNNTDAENFSSKDSDGLEIGRKEYSFL